MSYDERGRGGGYEDRGRDRSGGHERSDRSGDGAGREAYRPEGTSLLIRNLPMDSRKAGKPGRRGSGGLTSKWRSRCASRLARVFSDQWLDARSTGGGPPCTFRLLAQQRWTLPHPPAPRRAAQARGRAPHV